MSFWGNFFWGVMVFPVKFWSEFLVIFWGDDGWSDAWREFWRLEFWFQKFEEMEKLFVDFDGAE